MANCNRISDLFSEYVENDLPRDDAAKVQAHLAACPSCKERVDQLMVLRQRLTGMHQVKTTDDFDLVLRARIQMSKKIGRSTLLPQFFVNRSPLFNYAMATAAVLLLVFTGSLMLSPQSETPRNSANPSPYMFSKSQLTFPFDRVRPSAGGLKRPAVSETAGDFTQPAKTSAVELAGADSTAEQEARRQRARRAMKKYVIPVSF